MSFSLCLSGVHGNWASREEPNVAVGVGCILWGERDVNSRKIERGLALHIQYEAF